MTQTPVVLARSCVDSVLSVVSSNNCAASKSALLIACAEIEAETAIKLKIEIKI